MMEPQRAFYRPPSCLLKTSAEIISEARAEMATKPVNTKRPFTPRERQRTLFGSLKAGTSRPPSSISLRQVEFQDVENNVKLPPLRSTSSVFKVPNRLPPWRLPDFPSRVSSSLSNLPEEVEVEPPTDIRWSEILRQTHSSPQERTDFTEKVPRPRNLSALTSSWYQREKASLKNKNYLRRKHSNFKGLAPRNDSIKESDENDDVQTLTINHPNKCVNYFKTPSIQPLLKSKSSTDIVEDNRINEKKDVEKPVETVTIIDLINKINALHDNCGKENSLEQEVTPILTELYPKVQSEMTHKGSNKVQSLILKSLYKYVENASDPLLLQISKIILALRVKGPNLSSVTKLIFKVSRSDKNDSLFLEGDLLELFVESLGRASPIDDAEACIYGYGALKFLTMNQQLLLVALRLGILDLMVLHLKIVNNARLELLAIPEQTSHAMFQLTGTLRNVASEEITLSHFVKTGAIGQLCTSMELFSADLDLVSNLARTISILSTHNECCDSIIMHENSFRSIIKIFNKYPGRQDIIVRFAYALGNIIAKSESARYKLYKEPGSMTAILNILENYLDKDLEQMKKSGLNSLKQNSPEWASDGSIEDVIIKMIRIVANMSMNYDVGIGMTCVSYIYDDTNNDVGTIDQQKAQDGGRFLDLLLMVLRRKSAAESEELVMSTLSTLNNLSYYAEPDAASEGPFALRQIEITQVLSTLLLTKNEESMIEVTRVLGNLTRSKEVRDYILEIGGISQLVRCLEHENKELLFTTTGVLVNLMADWDKRLAFKEAHGVQRLIVVLKQSCEGDWRLASLVCQALWNFCIDSTHLYAALGIQPTNSLLAVLVDLLDEEKLFGVTEGSEVPDRISESAEYRLWEQFANVATNLLEKIEQYLENLQAFNEK
ncbi:armadillo repeat-containing protein 2 [Cimex lectularius]|uniref:VHS domain-containing protein n=1 Tax=Cimex lectularius TaxID=79782 RepID=A0A8I6RTF9_CIMLE|nr:armadillo repeat-containing protein 2 [Cimex lectularius]